MSISIYPQGITGAEEIFGFNHTNTADFTLSYFKALRHGNLFSFWLMAAPITTITATADGNVTDTTIGYLPPDRPDIFPMRETVCVLADGYTDGAVSVYSDGEVKIRSAGSDLGAGRNMRISGTWVIR